LFTHELAEHRDYLGDAPRLDAYRRALKEVVTAETRVLDLGAGSGILGLLACEAGASRVTAVDCSDMLEVARAVAEAGPYREGITHVRGWSTQVTLPEPVDLVVADQMDAFAIFGGLLDAFADARRRHLRPGGLTMPSAISLFLAPVEHAGERRALDFWSARPAGFDFAAVRTMAVNNRAWIELEAASLLAEPARVARFELAGVPSDVLALTATFIAARAGALHGWGGWFSAQLSPGVAISNAPTDPLRIDRKQQLLPLDQPEPIVAGTRLDVRLVVRPREEELAWSTVIVPPAGGRPRTLHQATFLGRPMTRESLAARRGDHRPVRSAWGEARAAILALCDGRHTVAEIEANVLARFGELFASPQLASAFVREVLARGAG
jgi:SAM-dependent methyltransferase